MDILATTVCRTAPPGTVHGQLIQCDINSGKFNVLVELEGDFQSMNPRGGDRGFRDVAYDTETSRYFVTAVRSVHVLDANFQTLTVFSHRAFRHLHNIVIDGRRAYINSTGADRIIEMDIDKLCVNRAWYIHPGSNGTPQATLESDPPASEGPWRYHFNSIQVVENSILFGGAKSNCIFHLHNNAVKVFCPLPKGSHDFYLQPHQLTYFDTEKDKIVSLGKGRKPIATKIADHPEAHKQPVSSRLAARPNFLRGHCVLPETNIMAFGFSPTRIGLYNLKDHTVKKVITLSDDVRWMVSGVCVD